MAAGGEPKGTVTALGSLFPAEEARKAVDRVHGAIADRRRELDRFLAFSADNANLVNLVQRLPEELSHDIMVPFGSAAFFPGTLRHTNEFLVLLGEGYYAERTSKQTVEILQRRGKSLEAQGDSLKATVLDLETEAKFFDSTALEAAQGIVEIREDFVEKESINKSESGASESNFLGTSKAEDTKMSAMDEEYARVMARLDELEKQELAEEEASSDHEELDEVEDEELAEEASSDHEELDEVEEEELASGVSGSGNHEDNAAGFDFNMTQQKSDGHLTEAFEDFSENIGKQTSVLSTSGRRAFTGSIVEHCRGLPPINSTKSSLDEASGSNPAKPVSRFKMQRGGR